MSVGLAFWIAMLVALLFGGAHFRSSSDWRPFGGAFFIWLLLFLLGWGMFGPPIRG